MDNATLTLDQLRKDKTELEFRISSLLVDFQKKWRVPLEISGRSHTNKIQGTEAIIQQLDIEIKL